MRTDSALFSPWLAAPYNAQYFYTCNCCGIKTYANACPLDWLEYDTLIQYCPKCAARTDPMRLSFNRT